MLDIKNKLTKEEEIAYLRSMSILLHEMRTSINGGIWNPIRFMHTNDQKDPRIEQIYVSTRNLFALCDLIPIIEKIELGTSPELIKRHLLKTSFFSSEPSTDLICATLGKVGSETEFPTHWSIDGNDKPLGTLITKDGVFGTTVLYEVLFAHMIRELRDTSKRAREDGSIKIGAIINERSIRFVAVQLEKEKYGNDELSIQKPFALFNLILTSLGLGELTFTQRNGMSNVELICY